MVSTKYKILVIDKKEKYSFLFKGFRKHKFVISEIVTLLTLDEKELNNYNLFFIVIYELIDLLEVLKNHKVNKPIIIASENTKIINKIDKLKCFSIVDLSSKFNPQIQLHEAIFQNLNL